MTQPAIRDTVLAMPTALLLASALCAAVYWTRAGLGDGFLPLASAAPVVRLVALLLLVAAFVAASLVKREAKPAFGRGFARYELGSGIAAAKPAPRSPWRPVAFLFGLSLFATLGASFVFDDAIEWRASVERNALRRGEGARRFVAARPSSPRVDDAIDLALREPDYVKAGASLAANLPAPQRGRVLARVLDKISREPRERAIEAVAAVIAGFPAPEHAKKARRLYADYVARPLTSTRGGGLSDGARALLLAYCEAASRDADPVLGIVARPEPGPKDGEAAEAVHALAAAIAERVPFDIHPGDAAAPMRLELRWSIQGERLLVFAKLVGSVRDAAFEGEYPMSLGAGAGRAVADSIGHDLLP